MKGVDGRTFQAALLAAIVFWLASTDSSSQVQLQPVVVAGLSRPVLITHARDDRIFIVEQPGTVRIFYGGGLLAAPFLNLTDLVTSPSEQGLLGLAFHPDYPDTPFVFVHFTSNGNILPDGTDPASGENLIVRYTLSADPNVVDQSSAKVLLRIPQPFSNHNGGMIAFGPDGYLYISKGDGGSGNDPFSAAQNPENLLGKILRLDVDQNVDVPPYYGIPPSNPYSTSAGRDEVFLLGLRNPWRFSFDGTTGDLWIGDVGQDSREEINRLPINASAPGSNFGWRIFEGTSCTGLNPCVAPAKYVPPILDYSSAASPRCSVTGGYVYRGSLNPGLIGEYIFADYCTGEIFRLSQGTNVPLLSAGNLISSFGENSRGELYVAGHGTGQILKLIPVPAPMASINGRVLGSRGRGAARGITVVRRDIATGEAISAFPNTSGFYSFPNNVLNREYGISLLQQKGGTFGEKRFVLTDDFYGIDLSLSIKK